MRYGCIILTYSEILTPYHIRLNILLKSIGRAIITEQSLIITKTRVFIYIENFTSKNWEFSDKNSDIFHIYVQNIDCGYSFVLSRNKKNNVYPCTPQFYYLKLGFKVSKLYRHVFVITDTKRMGIQATTNSNTSQTKEKQSNLSPVVQSIVSITSTLMVNSLTVVAKLFSNTL